MLKRILHRANRYPTQRIDPMYKKYDVVVDPADGQRYYVDPVTGEVV